ncbi:MAG: endolytic transglycosylase MltG [Clostridia bacterium]|nr:endolytic transglycosylase MltG [Clostridia bacterium]
MKKLIIGIVAIILVIIIGIFAWYNSSLKPVSKLPVEENELIRVEIEKGLGTNQIAKVLEKNNVIKSATAMKIYTSLNDVTGLQAGIYDFNNSEDLETILNRIVNGEVAIDEVKITFIEGKNIRWIAKTIAKNTNNTEQDVFNLLEDEAYIDELINKYWFLTDEIKDDRIYYPLEGYLLPDTYIFENKDVSVKTIFNVILNFTDKYLTKYKDAFANNSMSIHQLLTMASLCELEGKSLEDRKEIIGVFYNRIVEKMSLGSDVTTYYAFKVDMGDRDLTVKELNSENPYNTRGPNMAGKIPVGPICNPSKEAIDATLNYTPTDAFYFVADKNGDVYFTKNNNEHVKMIQKLKREGKWFTYN